MKLKIPIFLFGLLMLALMAVTGCGSSSPDGGQVGTGSSEGGLVQPGPTANIIVRSVLARAVPATVTDFRFTGRDGQSVLVFGPATRPKAAEITLTVPITTKTLTIDYIQAGGIVGTFTQNVTLIAGQSQTISDPPFVATPNKLAFTVQPANSLQTKPINPAIQVAIQDFTNTTVATANNNVTLAIGNNAGNGTLSGTLTVTAVNGVATFNNLTIDNRGTGYTLVASTPGLTSATSSAFNESAAAGIPFKLAFGVQPSTINATSTITPALLVLVQDVNGTTVGSANTTVNLTIATNPSNGTLSGTTSAAAVNGVATFSNVTIDNIGNGYILSASGGAQLTAANSVAFNVTKSRPKVYATDRSGRLWVIDPITFVANNVALHSPSATGSALGLDALTSRLFVPGIFTGQGDQMDVFSAPALTGVNVISAAQGNLTTGQIAFDATRKRVFIPGPGGLKVFTTDTIVPAQGSPVAVGGNGNCFGAAFDSKRDRIYTFTQDAQQTKMLVVIDAATLTAIPGSPFALTDPQGNFDTAYKVAYDPVNDNIIWTTGSGSGQKNLHVYKAATLTPMAGSPFQTGTTCRGLAVDNTNNRVYVCNFQDNTLSVFNATNFQQLPQSPISTIDLNGAATDTISPESVTYNANSNRVFVTNFNGFKGGITVFDAATGTQVQGSPILNAPFPQGDNFDQIVSDP